MTAWAQREYTEIAELRGPLIVVRGVAGVGWDEFGTIRIESGETRHGLVLEADRDLAVVQVLEGTDGDAPTATRVAFSGAPAADSGRHGLAGPGVQRPGRTDRRRPARHRRRQHAGRRRPDQPRRCASRPPSRC